jgi:hypothetical protein
VLVGVFAADDGGAYSSDGLLELVVQGESEFRSDVVVVVKSCV